MFAICAQMRGDDWRKRGRRNGEIKSLEQLTARVCDGWLEGARRVPSSNCNERPDPTDISLLVIHNISLPPGEFGGGQVQAFFCNELDCSAHPYFDHLREVCVSAHLFIERDGQVSQFVPFEQRAWHAGVSEFEGRSDCNNYSIGIELEGTDHDAYTEAQYRQLARVTRAVMQAYPAITPQRICGHVDIAPDRKTDPGSAFDWRYFLATLAAIGDQP